MNGPIHSIPAPPPRDNGRKDRENAVTDNDGSGAAAIMDGWMVGGGGGVALLCAQLGRVRPRGGAESGFLKKPDFALPENPDFN